MNDQVKLMNTCMKHVDEIVSKNQRHKYHLILGKQIIGSYDTLGEMRTAADEEFPFIACIYYIPSPPTEVK